jgi:oligopeptide transport system ATP-binding protein
MNENGNDLISIQDLRVHFKLSGSILSNLIGETFRSFSGAVNLSDAAEPRNLKIKTSGRVVKAVDGVTLSIKKGETLGLVGESGCGKSTLGKAILRLTEPTGGQVFYNGKDLAHLGAREMREQRKNLQMIFQDPYASLNPRMTVGQIIGEPIRTFGLKNGKSIEERVQDLMETVGMSRRFVKRYPHEFSGGQRQRIGIARALAVDPEFIVADEPISALDVSIQAQIMNLMERLQAEKNLTYLFISHDLRAVRHLSDRVAVMYLGKIVELAGGKEVYREPLMPYTIALISAVPVPDPEIEAKRERIILVGDVPSPINPPSGCPFHTRCQYAIEECKRIVPKLVEIKPKHYAACIRINSEKPYIEENAKEGLGAIGTGI